MTTNRVLALLIAYALCACGTEDSKTPNSSSNGDGNGNGNLTARELLNGTWEFETQNSLTRYELRPDNTYTLTEYAVGTNIVDGVFQLRNDGTLAFDAEDSTGVIEREIRSWYVSDTQFALNAMIAQGSVTGLVGQWDDMWINETENSVGQIIARIGRLNTWMFASDGTFTGTSENINPVGIISQNGTWTESSPGVFDVLLEDVNAPGTYIELQINSLDGQAMAGDVFTRMD